MQLRLHLIRVLTLYGINYSVLIFALFDKLDNIRTNFDEEITTTAAVYPAQKRRKTRHLSEKLGGFSSRNFTSREQLLKFFNQTNPPTFYSQLFNFKRGSTRRKREEDYVPPTPMTPTGGAVTVDGTTVSIQSQFGPVGVNNPTVLMRNASPTTVSSMWSSHDEAKYETRRVGPTPLPLFTPPPLPPTPEVPLFRKQNFGPDWNKKNLSRIFDTTVYPFFPNNFF